VVCVGCPESRIDTARVRNFLKENGWSITNELKNADLILFRTCGLTERTAGDSLQIIRKIRAEKRPDAKFIVWGCLPKIDPQALRAEYEGVTFGEREVTILNKILEAKKPIEEITANYEKPVLHFGRSGFLNCIGRILESAEKRFDIGRNSSVFLIKVSTGCLGNCSFCAVRISRGLICSKSIDSILSEFRKGLKMGFQRFGLLGTDLGYYGMDLGQNLVDLLREMMREKGNYKIGLRNVNPYCLNEMFDSLEPIFSSGKIWFLSTAVESGSDRILKLMRRKYTSQDFKKCIKILNERYPNIFLRTQIMVGFPTETEEDFQTSLHFLDKLKFDWVEVYKFSPRIGTDAFKMDGQVPEEIKEARFRQLSLKALMQHPYYKVKNLIESFS